MSSKKSDPQLADISEKLSRLIHLAALALVKDIKKQKQQITVLSDAGFEPKQIADILGTNRNVVSVTLNIVKKERAKKNTEAKPELKTTDTPQNAKEATN